MTRNPILIQRKHLDGLLFILLFYLGAQVFQQYVFRIGPMSHASGLEDFVVMGQHPLNLLRLFLVLVSMFLMAVGYTILSLYFFHNKPLLVVLAILFFLLFCFLEICYRSVELFQVVQVWGKAYVQETAEMKSILLRKIKDFDELVNAIYFPLLLAHLVGSGLLFFASMDDKATRLVTIAMAANSIRLGLRLTEYTPFTYLNIFGGAWYFPPVAIILLLLIVWTVKVKKSL